MRSNTKKSHHIKHDKAPESFTIDVVKISNVIRLSEPLSSLFWRRFLICETRTYVLHCYNNKNTWKAHIFESIDFSSSLTQTFRLAFSRKKKKKNIFDFCQDD